MVVAASNGDRGNDGGCAAWTYFEDGLCHLHASDKGKNQNRHPLPVSGTMKKQHGDGGAQHQEEEAAEEYEWYGFGT